MLRLNTELRDYSSEEYRFEGITTDHNNRSSHLYHNELEGTEGTFSIVIAHRVCWVLVFSCSILLRRTALQRKLVFRGSCLVVYMYVLATLQERSMRSPDHMRPNLMYLAS